MAFRCLIFGLVASIDSTPLVVPVKLSVAWHSLWYPFSALRVRGCSKAFLEGNRTRQKNVRASQSVLLDSASGASVPVLRGLLLRSRWPRRPRQSRYRENEVEIGMRDVSKHAGLRSQSHNLSEQQQFLLLGLRAIAWLSSFGRLRQLAAGAN